MIDFMDLAQAYYAHAQMFSTVKGAVFFMEQQGDRGAQQLLEDTTCEENTEISVL